MAWASQMSRPRPHDAEEQSSTVHYANVTDALAPFKDDPLLFEPGTSTLYSTYGFDVLGCVIEGAAGAPFMDVMRRSVFEPAGMVHTRDDDPAAIIPQRAAGYVRVKGELRNAVHVDMSNRLPAGGYVTTAPELATFAALFIDGRLESRASSGSATPSTTDWAGRSSRTARDIPTAAPTTAAPAPAPAE
jgi:CubicO group peptidase (beta-lactamase class C family)